MTKPGDGGAGPYHGIFALGSGDSEDITDRPQTRKPFRWTEATNPYEWEDPCSQEDVVCDEAEGEEDRPMAILNVPGALYICHFGCAIRFFLIVNGTCFGQVWRDAQAEESGILPERDWNGKHLSFA